MKSRKKRFTASTVIIAILLYSALAILALLCLIPMWHVLMSSFTDPLLFMEAKGLLFWPKDGIFSTESYQLLFTNKFLWRSYLNTIVYTVLSVLIGLILSFMAAYALCRKDMVFKRPLLLIILITLFFNGGIVPFFIVVNRLGMIDTPMSMILPTCCNAMNIVMLRTGILAIPDSFAEAAEIDGASQFRIMLRIVMPLTLPFIVVVVLFNAIAQWNSWANASMFLSEEHRELYPLQLVLRDILAGGSNHGIDVGSMPAEIYLPGVRMAAVIVASLPLMIAYPFLQKHFEKGMIIGGIKG